MKIGMTGKKYGRRLHKTDRKKMLQKPENTGIANKKNGKQHPQNTKDSG